MIVLTGNGFNYMINSFISGNTGFLSKEYSTSKIKLENLTTEISSITSLWKEFDELFRDLKKNYPEIDNERLIKMINSVLDFLSNSDYIQEILPECRVSISELNTALQKVIANKIFEICQKFKVFEENDYHKLLKKIFPDFSPKFRKIIEKNENQVLYVTTNYDGIKDTLLCDSDNRCFIPDGFGKSTNGNLTLQDWSFKKDKLLLHLHGSYKFQKETFETIKIRKGEINKNPVLIFNQPELKGKQINADPVLSIYFTKFRQRLNKGKNLVIIGNSLNNEPHILEQIEKLFNKEDNKILIFDADPNKVKGNIMKVIKNPRFKIITFNTREFNHQDEFFEVLKNNL